MCNVLVKNRIKCSLPSENFKFSNTDTFIQGVNELKRLSRIPCTVYYFFFIFTVKLKYEINKMFTLTVLEFLWNVRQESSYQILVMFLVKKYEENHFMSLIVHDLDVNKILWEVFFTRRLFFISGNTE